MSMSICLYVQKYFPATDRKTNDEQACLCTLCVCFKTLYLCVWFHCSTLHFIALPKLPKVPCVEEITKIYFIEKNFS